MTKEKATPNVDDEVKGDNGKTVKVRELLTMEVEDTVMKPRCRFASSISKLLKTVEDESGSCPPEMLDEFLESYWPTIGNSFERMFDGFKGDDCEGVQFDLDDRYCHAFDLDKAVAKNLFRSFLVTTATDRCRKGIESLNSTLSVSYTSQMALEFRDFVASERYATLHINLTLFRIAEENGHIYFGVARKFLSRLLHDSQHFINRLINDLKYFSSVNVPTSLHQDNKAASYWVNQNLLEQKLLLDLLFSTFYRNILCGSEAIFSILQLFSANHFGHMQTNSPFFNPDSMNLMRRLKHMYMITSIEILNLESVLVDQDLKALASSSTSAPLASDPEFMLKIDGLISSFAAEKAIAPLLLSWAVFLNRVGSMIRSQKCFSLYQDAQPIFDGLQSEDGPTRPREYAFKAFKLDVLGYLREIIYGDSFDETELNSNGYRGVFKGLFTALQVSFESSFLPQFDLLIDCYCGIFKNQPGLCIQFWEEDHGWQDRQSLLDTCKQRYPVQSDAFTNILKCLVSDVLSSGYLFRYLQRLSTLTLMTDFRRIACVINADENGVSHVTCNERLAIYPEVPAELGICIPIGTSGRVVSAPGDIEIVQWDISYSFWHLLMCLLDTSLRLPPIGSGTIPESLHSNITLLWGCLELFVAVIRKGGKIAAHRMIEHLSSTPYYGNRMSLEGVAKDIVSKLFFFIRRNHNIGPSAIATVVDCISVLSPCYTQDIWGFVRLSIFFSSTPSRTLDSLVFNSANGGLLQQMRNSDEYPQGHFPLTTAFLQFFEALLTKYLSDDFIDCNRLLEAQSVVELGMKYLVNDILTNFSSWRYVNTMDRFRIGRMVVRMLRYVVDNKKSSEKDVCNQLISSFLYGDATYRTMPLMDILVQGYATTDMLYSRNRKSDALVVEDLIKETLQLISALLNERKNNFEDVSILERLLIEKTIDGKNTTMLSLLSLYVIYEHDVEIGRSSLIVLNILCTLSSSWKPRVPSFVGCLGLKAVSLVDSCCSIIADDYSDGRHQAFIFNFIRSCIIHQPGLGHLFLYGPESKAGSVEKSKSPLTFVIKSRIRNWKCFFESKPSVFRACLRVVETIWKKSKKHHGIINDLRNDEQFWSIIYNLILRIVENDEKGGNFVPKLLLQSSAHEIAGLELRNGFPKNPHDRISSGKFHVTLERVPPGFDNFTLKLFDQDSFSNWHDCFMSSISNLLSELDTHDKTFLNRLNDVVDGDAVIDIFSSWSFFIGVAINHICTLGIAKKLPMAKDRIGGIFEKLLQYLCADQNASMIRYRLQAESAMLVVLVSEKWFGLMVESGGLDSIVLKKVFKMYHQALSYCSNISQEAYLSSTLLRRRDSALLSSVLLFVRAIKKQNFVSAPTIADEVSTFLPLICRKLVLFVNQLRNTKNERRSLIFEVSLCISLIEEMILSSYFGHPNLWISIFDEYSLFAYLSDLLMLSLTSEKGSLYHLFTQSVSLIVALSSIPFAAKRLVQNGLIDQVLNRVAYSELSVKSDGDSNPSRAKMWQFFVTIFTNLLESIGGDSAVIEATLNFVSRNSGYFNQVLDIEMSKIESFSIPYGDIHQVIKLFSQLFIRYDVWCTWPSRIPTAFKEKALVLLQNLVILLSNDNALLDEQYISIRGYYKISQVIPDILADLLGIFILLANSSDTFLRSSNEWHSRSILFTPTMKVGINEPASIGTLFDIINYCSRHMKKDVQKSEISDSFFSIIQMSVTLLISQIALYLWSADVDPNLKQEMRSELPQDLKVSIQSVQSEIKKLPDWESMNNAKDTHAYLHSLVAFMGVAFLASE